jgi:hypothetical protein
VFSSGVTQPVSYITITQLTYLWFNITTEDDIGSVPEFLGNNWGICEDGSGAVGCGDYQETFVNCADIAIV